MMAQLLPSNPTRISQNLPTPKCSTCGQFVPLEDLGDHTCAIGVPPPLPKPTTTPAAVHALLPKRLQGRIPSRTHRGSPSRSASRSRSPPLSIEISSLRPQGARDRKPSNAAQPTSANTRETPTTARPSTARPTLVIPSTPRPTTYSKSPVSPPRNTPPGQTPPFPVHGRGGSPLGYRGSPRGLSNSPSAIIRNMISPRDTSTPSVSPQRLFPGTVGPGAGNSETHTARQSLVPPSERGIDTKTGGEAGMAGVGRRGFAAVARAAMFAPDRRLGSQPQRDSNQSNHLDNDGLSRQLDNSSEPTSPLPQSEIATQSSATRTPFSIDRKGILIGSTAPRYNRSRTPSASSISGSDEDGPSTRNRANSAAIAHALGLSRTPPSDYGRMGGPGMTRIRRDGSVTRRDGSLSRRKADPDSLEEMEKALKEAKIKTGNKPPSSSGSSSQHSLLYRADTISSIATSRKDNDIIENGGGGVRSHRSNTIQTSTPASPVKLPMRALTSPKFDRDKALDGTGGKKERARKARVCLKCLKAIDNERWVSVDGGGVLCEKCWKNMYLPKCRRCNLSIEKQAVSSSDGQLKGKYHKECFNCDTCHKPFPDKSFYVYDGKPLCAYHYHEANDSLCAAARCGQPIEGPCAVSHSGDRYHPEHMTCEHPGYPPCKQRLSEYWEIDGRMLCERHAYSASVRGSDVDVDEEWTKSKRRVTRFVDLTGGIEDFGDI